MICCKNAVNVALLLKICGGFEFVECLKIFMFKIKENVKEARKKKVCVFKFFLKKNKKDKRWWGKYDMSI